MRCGAQSWDGIHLICSVLHFAVSLNFIASTIKALHLFCSSLQVNKIVAVISNPLQFKIPSWMLNRNRDVKDGKTSQKYANFLDQALREDCPLVRTNVLQSCSMAQLY